MMKSRLFISLSIWGIVLLCVVASCSRDEGIPQLAWGKHYLWSAPDSAYCVLKTISSPEKLSEKERGTYALLMTQAMHRSGRKISSDSLIDIAIDYYSLQGTADEQAASFLYKGYILEDLGKDKKAIYAYKQAEEAVKTAKDLRLHFMVYTALGRINGRYAHYETSLAYYRKALDLNLSVPAWKEMGGGYIFAPLYLAQRTPRYNEEVKLVQDKFLGLVDRMDFSSQEKIYYQLALKEKDKKEWEAAASFLLKALERTSTEEARYKYDAELANVYKHSGKKLQADSLRNEALKSSRRLLRASVYKDRYTGLLADGFAGEANEYMQRYISELELLFTSADRAELLEIEKKYDYSALLRQNNDYRSRWSITILITVAAICSLALLLWGSWKFFRHQKLEILRNYKKDASVLQQQIDDLQERIEENQGEAKNLQEQMLTLEAEKRSKEVRIRQLEVTFRSKHISLPVETVEAAQAYLQIVSKEAANYNPAEDRTKLELWLNISRNDWARRLAILYPSLTNGEKDICYLFALGLSFDEMAELLGVQPRSVDRVVYRICRKMGLGQGSKEEFVAQISRLDDSATNI
ncbi:hypothetical protein [Phocaeicola sp.]